MRSLISTLLKTHSNLTFNINEFISIGKKYLTIFSRSVIANDFDKFVQKSVMTALHN